MLNWIPFTLYRVDDMLQVVPHRGIATRIQTRKCPDGDLALARENVRAAIELEIVRQPVAEGRPGVDLSMDGEV